MGVQRVDQGVLQSKKIDVENDDMSRCGNAGRIFSGYFWRARVYDTPCPYLSVNLRRVYNPPTRRICDPPARRVCARPPVEALPVHSVTFLGRSCHCLNNFGVLYHSYEVILNEIHCPSSP